MCQISSESTSKRYLNLHIQAYKGQTVNENVEYLVNIQTTLQTKFKVERAAQLMCPDYVRKLLRANAAYLVQ